jgi:periplasmic protein TonB
MTHPPVIEEIPTEIKLQVVEQPDSAEFHSTTSHFRDHSLASTFWTDIPLSNRPIRRPKIEEAQETFLRGMLDTPTMHGARSPLDWVISLLVHGALVGAVLVAPLMFTQGLDLRNLEVTFLEAPRPPAAAPALAPAPPAAQRAPRAGRNLSFGHLTAPTVVPRKIVIAKDEEPVDINMGGVAGGVSGGVSGGVLGGILGGTEGVPTATRPITVPAEKQTIHRVGGDLKPPRLLVRVDPQYPLLAKEARVQGVVMVDAVIDEDGNVVQAQVIDGPWLLTSSALQAVLQWKYEPTVLNGQRVSIAMHVKVSYSLHTAEGTQ